MADSTWPDVSLATLHDAARCLALAERGELAALPGGGLSRAGWRLLHSYAAADRRADRRAHPVLGEPDVPVLSWLFRSLGMGGLIGVVSGRIRPARTAHDWLAMTATAQLMALHQIWRNAPEVAWSWLPQQYRHPARARVWHTLTEQLLAGVAALPVDSWVLLAELAADPALQGATLGFGVERNLPSVRQALTRQAGQLVTFLLSEVLPRLGLVAVIGEGENCCLALTTEGAGWLRGRSGARKIGPGLSFPEQAPAPDPAGPEPACWQVADDLRLIIPLEAPAAATFEALQFADLLAIGPPAEYRITGASLERGLSQGYDLADIRFLLAQGAGQPLSGAAAARLAHWQEELTVIRCEPGYRLQPLAADVLSRLRDREPFRAVAEHSASGRWAFVSQAESAALMRYLRRSGYVLSPEAPGATAPPLLGPFLRRRLPLVPLATLVGVYDRLQVRVPGLADLGLDELSQTLTAALPPDSQAAVARLVASNAALIARHCAGLRADSDAAEIAAAPLAETAGPSMPGFDRISEVIETAAAAGVALEILYADTAGAVTQRRIRPLRLEERWGRQYVVAYCELRRDERSFRLDRIVQAEQV